MKVRGYVVGERIGEGSTGVVYEARQESPARVVALKLLRPELVASYTSERFRREAQVLGWLNHDGIARVFEVGLAEDVEGAGGALPFMAMELVRGQRIDAWAEARGLDPRERVELLLQLCDAVSHAHQRGVVHRDLKPANVLVREDGRLKVLDFGLARSSSGHAQSTAVEVTRPGSILGTLPYMSPEQVAGDSAAIDVRTDVYALGAIAYELLAGELPIDVAGLPLTEAARRITEHEPTTLGAHDRRLRGDLEVIVGKALAKDPARRYSSVDELAGDLRRHLADEPIAARPPSRSYQFAKFARRNRGLVAGLAITFIVLLAGAGTSATLYFQTSRVLEQITYEAETAEEVLSFLEQIFQQSDPNLEEVSVAEVARQAAARLEDFEQRPEVRARLAWVLGRTLSQLELPAEADPLLQTALDLRTELRGAKSLEVAEVLQRLASLRGHELKHDEEEQLYLRCLEILEAHDERGALRGEALLGLVNAGMAQGRFAEAEARLIELESLLGSISDPSPELALQVRYVQAVLAWHLGDLVAAEELLTEILAAESAWPTLRIRTQVALGVLIQTQRREVEALEHLREAARLADEEFGPVTAVARSAKSRLAGLLASMGEVEEPVEIMRTVHAETVRRFGLDSVLAAESLQDLAFALHDLPDKTEAEAKYLEAIERLEAVGRLVQLYQAQHNLSILYLDLGRMEEAERWERRSLEGREREHGAEDTRTLVSLRGLGVIYFRQGRFGEATEIRRELLRRCQRALGEGNAVTQDARLGLANVLRAGGEFAEAEALLLEVESALPRLPAATDTAPRLRRHMRDLYSDWGRPEDAALWAEPGD